MKEERKKVERNPIGSITPKKRVEPVEPITHQIKTQEIVTTVSSKAEPKVDEAVKTALKFVKVCDGSEPELRKEIGDRVMRGELKWHHYAIDGDKGCHHYLILKS
jgi:hypothetical protein